MSSSYEYSESTTSDEEYINDSVQRTIDAIFLTQSEDSSYSEEESTTSDDYEEDDLPTPPAATTSDEEITDRQDAAIIRPDTIEDDSSSDSSDEEYQTATRKEFFGEILSNIDFTDNYTKSTIQTRECDIYFEESKCHVCHKCGKAYSLNALMDSYKYSHLKGKRICCGDCGTAIELSLLQRLSDENTVLEHLKETYKEKIDTPAFSAYEEAIKLLHERGLIGDISEENKSIIFFLKKLIVLSTGPVMPVHIECPYELRITVERLDNTLTTAINDTPCIFLKDQEMVKTICDLPSVHGLSEEVRPIVINGSDGQIKTNTTDAYYYRQDAHIGFIPCYSYSIETDEYSLIVHEQYIKSIPLEDAIAAGYEEMSDDRIEKINIPGMGLIDITKAQRHLTRVFHIQEPCLDKASLFKLQYQFSRKEMYLVPNLAARRKHLPRRLEESIPYLEYLVDVAKRLLIFFETDIDDLRKRRISRIVRDIEIEIPKLKQEMKNKNRLPSEIIAMVYNCIEYAGYIPDHITQHMNRIYGIFTRHCVPLSSLIDATMNALFPDASACTKYLILKTLKHDGKINEMTCCPSKFLKRLSTDADHTCECGGAIINDECVLCKSHYCIHCHEKMKENHTCSQEKLDTMKVLEKTTVKCPRCHLRIQKSQGCDHMFCTQCHCNFDWVTGKAIAASEQTNEMFFDYMTELEHEYSFYLTSLMEAYEDIAGSTETIKDRLYFMLIHEKVAGDGIYQAEIRRCLRTLMEHIINKEIYNAMRPEVAAEMADTLSIYGEAITDYDADELCNAIVDKAIIALRAIVC